MLIFYMISKVGERRSQAAKYPMLFSTKSQRVIPDLPTLGKVGLAFDPRLCTPTARNDRDRKQGCKGRPSQTFH